MQNDIKKVLSYSISKDYIQAFLEISEENSGSTLIDKIADNVFETSAWTDEGIWSNDDIRMAIGRVLLSRLNANSPAVPLELLTIGSEYTTCEVIEITPDYIVLQEEDEKLLFKLSKEEFSIAAVKCK